jgi:hypothetical protein
MSTELDAIIGAVVTAVTRARRLADEETAAVAEHYRATPLLSGMSVPRVRLPEVTIDVPVIVDTFEPSVAGKPASVAAVNNAAREGLKLALEERQVAMPTGLLSRFRDHFAARADKLPTGTDRRTVYGDLADQVLTEVIRGRGEPVKLDPATVRLARQRMREAVEAVSVETPSTPANLKVSILTSDIQAVAPESVTRIQIRLREEGVEWTTIERDDGSSVHQLVPE